MTKKGIEKGFKIFEIYSEHLNQENTLFYGLEPISSERRAPEAFSQWQS
jgi:hypothetical protein